MKLTIDDLIVGCHGALVSPREARDITGISNDTRTVASGDCYIALRGERFDGHTFIKTAYEKGAHAALIDHVFLSDLIASEDQDYQRVMRSLPNLIVVQDTMKSFGYLAAWYRKQHNVHAVGITGSCGKTTTKELTKRVLAHSFSVCATEGNLNNHIGVPQTLCKLRDEHTMLVCEMGASMRGDIAYLSHMLAPEIGIVTNVHPAHLSSFGSIDVIYKTKLELAEYLDSINGTVVVYGDDERLVREARTYDVSVITFGKKSSNDFVLTNERYEEGKLLFEINAKYSFSLPMVAQCTVYNAMAALAVADYFSLSLFDLRDVFETYAAPEGRAAIRKGKIVLIDDAYNANPQSFAQSLLLLKHMRTKGNKVVICGDMLELGKESGRYHRDLARHIAASGATRVMGVGKEIHETIATLKKEYPHIVSEYCCDNQTVIAQLEQEVKTGDIVLVKGSHGIHLEEVVRAMSARFIESVTV